MQVKCPNCSAETEIHIPVIKEGFTCNLLCGCGAEYLVETNFSQKRPPDQQDFKFKGDPS